MATAEEFIVIALSLDGAATKPHFDRQAFYVKRIFASLAPDGLTANLMFTPDQQHFKCIMHPNAFHTVANKWGEKGATTVILANVDEDTLQNALELAWQRAK